MVGKQVDLLGGRRDLEGWENKLFHFIHFIGVVFVFFSVIKKCSVIFPLLADPASPEVEQKGAQARDSGMTEWLMKQDQARDKTNQTMMTQDESLIVEAKKQLKAAWDRFSQIGQEIMKAKKEFMLVRRCTRVFDLSCKPNG